MVEIRIRVHGSTHAQSFPTCININYRRHHPSFDSRHTMSTTDSHTPPDNELKGEIILAMANELRRLRQQLLEGTDAALVSQWLSVHERSLLTY